MAKHSIGVAYAIIKYVRNVLHLVAGVDGIGVETALIMRQRNMELLHKHGAIDKISD
jgi:hypothetical protein